MENLEKLVDVKFKAVPEVENIRCCNCCALKKGEQKGNIQQRSKWCDCCSKIVVIKQAMLRPALSFTRRISP